jgi:hypothetical protein
MLLLVHGRSRAQKRRLRRLSLAGACLALSVVTAPTALAQQGDDKMKCYPEYQTCGFYCGPWCGP